MAASALSFHSPARRAGPRDERARACSSASASPTHAERPSRSCPAACASCSTSPWRWSARPKLLLLDEPTSGVRRRRNSRPWTASSMRVAPEAAMTVSSSSTTWRSSAAMPTAWSPSTRPRHRRRRARPRRCKDRRRAPLRHRQAAHERREPLLEIDDLLVAIQSMEALRGFSLRRAGGAMVGLVGRNGAGKTTLMRTIMGHLPVPRPVPLRGTDLAARAAPRPRRARHRLHAGGPRPGAASSRWKRTSCCRSGSPAPDRKERLDLVYGVLPRARADARAQGAAALRRPAEAGRARPRAGRRHPPACCSTSPSRASRRRCRSASSEVLASLGQGPHLC